MNHHYYLIVVVVVEKVQKQVLLVEFEGQEVFV